MRLKSINTSLHWSDKNMLFIITCMLSFFNMCKINMHIMIIQCHDVLSKITSLIGHEKGCGRNIYLQETAYYVVYIFCWLMSFIKGGNWLFGLNVFVLK